jgi:hypothetical protein
VISCIWHISIDDWRGEAVFPVQMTDEGIPHIYESALWAWHYLSNYIGILSDYFAFSFHTFSNIKFRGF